MPKIINYIYKNIHYICLVLVILAAAILRFYDLKGESYWYDEFITLEVVTGDIKKIIFGGRPQLYLIIAFYWTKIFGVSETATRSLSCIFGTLAIPLIYLVGKELFNKRVGLISSLLMSVSQFQIYYSQEFRYYSLYSLFTLISFYFFILYQRKPGLKRLVFYIISTVLMYYSHDFAIFTIMAQAVYYLSSIYKNRKTDYHLMIGFFIISLPIIKELKLSLSKVAIKNAGPAKWLPDTSIYTPLETLRNYIGSGLDYPSYTMVLSGLLFLLIGSLIFILRNGHRKWMNSLINTKYKITDVFIKKEILLIMLWLLIPILIPFIISELINPIYHHRYTIGASPSFYILIAVFIVFIRRIIPEIVVLGVIIIVLAPGLYKFYKIPVREQWRESAMLIKKNFQKNDIFVFNNDKNNINALKWYYKENFKSCIVNTNQEQNQFLNSLNNCTRGYDRFWFIVREVPDPLPEKLKSILSDKQTENLNLIGQFNFTKITVYLFEIRNNGTNDT